MMASASKMASLPPNVQKVIRDAAVEAVQKEMWEANLKAQESAWTELAKRSRPIRIPTSPASARRWARSSMASSRKAGPKGKALVEAVQAAGKA